MIELRDYQQKSIDMLKQALREGFYRQHQKRGTNNEQD
jgi:hypothetical protein